uniref:hypothetical protein ycf33 n=1 Tax=Cryptomonas gyropyrenoidosa TaxID=233257 RepID=UPI0027A000F8|nr:hypothetical protein ycf33 [Cryptomonas gyropyrenoidosa]WFQ83038.1 hypothetical protein ycf33 [Cryptomonas gyropyrenoidosa]
MSDFWENLLRFPRFFISSTLGLVLIILGPFFNLLKRPQTTVILIISTFLVATFLICTLKAMLNL